MRKQILFFALILTIVMIACHEPNKEWRQTGSISSYELSGPAGKDTVNLTYDGKKEGRWVVKEHVKVEVSLCKDSTHKETDKHAYTKTVYCVTEEGFYKNNLKEGLWVHYDTDGSIKDSVVYKNGEVVK
jgi:antitoxin component YwqK of YwqJK toxin-antitoxin module